MNIVCVLTLFGFLVLGANGVRYVEDYFDQKLDHFNFVSYDARTYKERYIYNDTWWDRENGPIFFYAGNEGDVVRFWDNSGFVFKAASTFKALVVFAEHRYYGKSLPFGNDSFTHENIGLLSVEQALSDYAFFLTSFKQKFKAEKSPVVAFGGSYGGMLAAYMRFKFPNIVIGAIAASAPIYQLAGLTSGDLFYQAVTKDFREVSTLCEQQVRAGYAQLEKWARLGKTGLSKISRTFNLCQPLQSRRDYHHLLRWSRNAFATAAMADYPYSSSLVESLPAFPVNAMCDLLQTANKPEVGLYMASVLVYRTPGTERCSDIYEEFIECADPTGCGHGFDSMAYDYQTCTEINVEASTNGVLDMFPYLPFTASMRDEYCMKTWKVQPRRDYLKVVYWGENISSSSNIVFSNGNLDPWAQGGVSHNISDSLVAILIEGGAHHFDLREDNPKDPDSVRFARDFELRNIQKWLQTYYNSYMT